MIVLTATAALAVLLPASQALALCNPPASAGQPPPGTTVTCTGNTTDANPPNGYGDGSQNQITVNVQPGASVTGTSVGIRLQGGNTINNAGTVSGTNAAIFVNNNNTIINSGTLTSLVDGVDANTNVTVVNSGNIAVGLVGINAFTVNLANSGTIAADTGVFGDTVTVSNSGFITATSNAIQANNAAFVTNSGTISGFGDGIQVGNPNATIVVNNSGTIIGQSGVGIDSINPGGVMTVNNSGLIAGSFAAIFGSNVNLNNSGTVTGTGGPGSFGVFAANANITNSGTISGSQAIVTSTGTITNFGVVSGTGPGSMGIVVNSAVINNSGIISGDTGVFAINFVGPPGATLTNSGTIIGTGGTAINFSLSTADTLNFLPGSRIFGQILLGLGDTVNIRTGRDIAWLLTFGTPCGCGGLIATGSTVNFSGGGPFAVNGDKVATLDATAFGMTDRTLMDFTGNVSSLLANRFGEFAAVGGSTPGATAFAPAGGGIADAANAAFAGIPSLATAYAAADKGIIPNATVVNRTSGIAVWSKAFVGGRKQDGDDVVLRSTNTVYGGAIGVDAAVAPDLRLGGFLGAGYGRFNVDLSSQTIDTDYVFGGAYGRFDRGSHFFDAVVSTGHSANRSSRLIANNLAPNGFDNATASYDGWYVTPEFATGVRIPVGVNMTLTPTGRVRYLAGWFDSYAEAGSAQNLSVGRRTVQDLEERLELVLSRTDAVHSHGVIKTMVDFGVLGLQRLGDTTVNTVLIGQNVDFAAPGRNAVAGAYAGIALDYRIDNRIGLFAGAEGIRMNDKSAVGTAKAGARFAF
jgi:hypothetical protein